MAHYNKMIFSTIFCLLLQQNIIMANTIQKRDSPPSSPPEPLPLRVYPTCIIGGGISGLSLAIRLQEKGYLVHLFERETGPGGRMVTFQTQHGLKVDMGPLVYGTWHDSLLAYINEFQLKSTPFNITDVQGFDPTTGQHAPLAQLTPEQKGELESAAGKYLAYRAMYENDLNSFEYTNVSPDLFVPIGEWLDQRGLGSLKPYFWVCLTGQGYGGLDDTPALYALKLASREQFLARFSNGQFSSYFTLDQGMDDLAKRLAAKVPNLFLNTEVTKVTRRGPSPGAGANANDDGLPVLSSFSGQSLRFTKTTCHKVILACPPSLTNVRAVVEDLSEEERNIFAQVNVHKFASAANNIPGLDSTIYFESVSAGTGMQITSPKGIGEVFGLVRQSPAAKIAENIYTSYSWIKGDTAPNVADLIKFEANLRRALKKIHKDSKILHRQVYEHFPHVHAESLASGFYPKLQSLQGRAGVYYATTMLGFESLDAALKMTQAFVDKYF